MNMKILMEYNVKAAILYVLCPCDFMSQGRHNKYKIAAFTSCGRVFFSRGHELLSLSPGRYLLSCGLDFQSQLGV